ncbi:MAG: hypothetical protein ACI9W2_001393 [Gammaproteobacteria bacterium]|jgi:hypothetical protein
MALLTLTGAQCRAIVHRRCQPTKQCQHHEAQCTTGCDVLNHPHTLVSIKW